MGQKTPLPHPKDMSVSQFFLCFVTFEVMGGGPPQLGRVVVPADAAYPTADKKVDYFYYDDDGGYDRSGNGSRPSSSSSTFLSSSDLSHGVVSPKDVVVIIFVLCLWLYSILLMFRYVRN